MVSLWLKKSTTYSCSVADVTRASKAGCRWLMSVVLATQETEIKRITLWKPAQANSSQDPISKKHHHKKRAGRLVEWLKMKALNSNPSNLEKKSK
jgi:hypothetical protein